MKPFMCTCRAFCKSICAGLLLFSENWEVVGRTRKLIATVLQGRNTLLRFSDPLPLRSVMQDGLDPEIAFRKVSRILRVHFRQRRIATVGPDLSHRRTLTKSILRNPSVRRIIEQEDGDKPAQIEQRTREARKYTREIAAHISYPTVRATWSSIPMCRFATSWRLAAWPTRLRWNEHVASTDYPRRPERFLLQVSMSVDVLSYCVA